MKPLFTALALCFCILSFGQADLKVQTNEIQQVNDLENLLRELSYTRNEEVKVENVVGSAYLNDEFIEGIVALNNGSNYADVPLRYNVYNEEIEFRGKNGKEYNINNPGIIRELIIGESKFIYTEYPLKKEQKKVFAEVLSEGNVTLLKHHRIKLMPYKPAESHRPAQPPRLVKVPAEYLLKKAEGTAQPFKNEKELLKLLSDKSEELTELIDQQKFSIHNEADLIAIVAHYNGTKKIPLVKYHTN